MNSYCFRSNQTISCPVGQVVKTSPSHGGVRGSTPLRDTRCQTCLKRRVFYCISPGSTAPFPDSLRSIQKFHKSFTHPALRRFYGFFTIKASRRYFRAALCFPKGGVRNPIQPAERRKRSGTDFRKKRIYLRYGRRPLSWEPAP